MERIIACWWRLRSHGFGTILLQFAYIPPSVNWSVSIIFNFTLRNFNSILNIKLLNMSAVLGNLILCVPKFSWILFDFLCKFNFWDMIRTVLIANPFYCIAAVLVGAWGNSHISQNCGMSDLLQCLVGIRVTTGLQKCLQIMNGDAAHKR